MKKNIFIAMSVFLATSIVFIIISSVIFSYYSQYLSLKLLSEIKAPVRLVLIDIINDMKSHDIKSAEKKILILQKHWDNFYSNDGMENNFSNIMEEIN